MLHLIAFDKEFSIEKEKEVCRLRVYCDEKWLSVGIDSEIGPNRLAEVFIKLAEKLKEK